jgi:hypothetical protein
MVEPKQLNRRLPNGRNRRNAAVRERLRQSDARPADWEELLPVNGWKNLGRSRFLRQVYHRRCRALLLMAAGISNARSWTLWTRTCRDGQTRMAQEESPR